tara:strand:- start:398 stop:637 length:240 start_codon:yes stop_codon:yes gene_type:complete
MQGFVKGLIVGLSLILLIGATNYKNPSTREMENTEYQISTCAYQDKGGNIWVFETMINKTNGRLEYRKQVHSKKYKNIK